MAGIAVAGSSSIGVVHPSVAFAPYRHATTGRKKRRISVTKLSSLPMITTNTSNFSAAALKSSLLRDTRPINAAIPLFGEKNKNASSMRRMRSGIAGAASYYSVSIPPEHKVKEKPEWWWRTLSGAPYLMALQMSDAAFYFQPLMERYVQFQCLSYYIPGAINRLPNWFLMVYCFGVYMGIVRNREKWPHFFRYNVMMGLLLENIIQIVWFASNFMPLIHYKGTFAMPYWPIIGTLFIAALLYCVTCALRGKYVNFPFISEAAYAHTPYVRGDP